VAAAGLALACLTVTPLLARDASTAETLDALRRANTKARLAALKPDTPAATPLLAAAINAGARAARLDPDNWQLAVMLGQANLHLSNEAESAASRETATRAADEWFRKARAATAAARGLPEAVPKAAK
jgi:hypothetical protein